MPRNQNGTYTLPSGNPVVSGTTIDTSWANPTMADLGNEITNSLSRNGDGGMLVPFQNIDGAVGSPGITWTNETVTGFYRAVANDMRASIGGIDKFRWTANSVQIWDNTDLVWRDVATGGNLEDYLPLTGGTVTGQIKGVTPVDPEDLVRKDYVDAFEGGLQSFNTRTDPDVIPQLGDYTASIVGFDNGLTPFWGATEVQTALEEAYSDIQFLAGSITLKGIWDSLANTPDLLTIPKINGNYWIVSVEGSTALPPYPGAVITLPWLVNDRALYLDDGTDAGFAQIRQTAGGGDFLPLTGGTMLGQIKGVAPAPVDAADLTRKDYVDNAIAAIPPPDLTDYLPLTGGTMSGQIKGITPIDDADLTRKDYVLDQIANTPSGLTSFKGRTATDVVPIYDDYQADLVRFDNTFAPRWGTDVETALVNAYDDIAFLAGAVTLKGVWDALANVPDLTTIPKINGNYWIVSVEGSTVLPLFPGAPAFDLPYLVEDRVLYLDDGVDTGFVQLRPSTSEYLLLTGGTMSGQIKGITPVDAPDLTRKDYVDAQIAGIPLGDYLPLTGGTLTGNTNVLNLQPLIATSCYVQFKNESATNIGYVGKATANDEFYCVAETTSLILRSVAGAVQIDSPTALNVTAPSTNIDGGLLVNSNGQAITVKQTSADQSGYIRFQNSAGSSIGYIGDPSSSVGVSDMVINADIGDIDLNAPTTNVNGALQVNERHLTLKNTEQTDQLLFASRDPEGNVGYIGSLGLSPLDFRMYSYQGNIDIASQVGEVLIRAVSGVINLNALAVNINGSPITPSKAGTVASTGIGDYNVVFSTPFPDANYAITLSEGTTTGIGFDPNTTYSNKAATGFTVSTNTSTVPLNIDWTATPYGS